MPIKMKDLPEAERPYERLVQNGAENLTNAEYRIKSGQSIDSEMEVQNALLR